MDPMVGSVVSENLLSCNEKLKKLRELISKNSEQVKNDENLKREIFKCLQSIRSTAFGLQSVLEQK